MNTLLSIQILPQNEKKQISLDLIDAAIEVIAASGLPYRVNSLETNVEGDWEQLMKLITAMNERVLSVGASQTMFQIKLLHVPEGITMETLTSKYDQE
jgi:uncharacterized protein YqgV (UPF0045/DUF77 family)